MRKTIAYLFGLLQQSNNIKKALDWFLSVVKRKGDTLLVFSNHFHNGYRVDGAQRLEESVSTARMTSARIKKALTKQKMFEVGFRWLRRLSKMFKYMAEDGWHNVMVKRQQVSGWSRRSSSP